MSVDVDAPHAVLLPGNMCDRRLWQAHDGVLVRTVEQAGLAVAHADLTLDDSIAAMAARVLRDTSDRLVLVGFSLGAIVALEVARQAPERVAALVLMGLNASADLPERAAHRPEQQAEVRGGGLERVLVEELKPNYLAVANRGDAALLALLLDMGLVLGAEVFIRQSEALRRRDDLIPTLGDLRVPVLLICGDEDVLCPPEWHERWAALIPDAGLHCVAGAGHLLPLEAPERIADLLEVWLMEKL